MIRRLPLHVAIANYTDLKSNEKERKTALNAVLLHVHTHGSFLSLVEDLGPVLQDDNQLVREKGMLLFATVLDRLPDAPFNDDAVMAIIKFLVDRSADYICEAECIYGLWAMYEHHGDMASKHLHLIFKTIFGISVSSQLQKTRAQAYNIMKKALAAHPEMCLSFGRNRTMNEFVLGFGGIFDGEKDPRNVFLCLEVVDRILERFPDDLLELVSDVIFELCACYYPILFTPSKEEDSVHPEDLGNLLRKVLTRKRCIVDRFFPFVCDKLGEQSESKQDRLELFLTLQAIYDMHWSKETAAHMPEMWQAIKAATWYGQNDDPVYIAAQDLLKTMMQKTFGEYQDLAIEHTAYQKSVLRKIMEEIALEMRVPDSRLAREAAKTLAHLASTCRGLYRVCFAVHWEAMAKGLVEAKTPDSSKLAWAQLLLALAKQARRKFDDRIHPISQWGDALYDLLIALSAAPDEKLQLVAIETLTVLLVARDPKPLIADAEKIHNVIHSFCELLKLVEVPQLVAALIEIARVEPVAVAEYYVAPALERHPFFACFAPDRPARAAITVSGAEEEAVNGLYLAAGDLCFENVRQKHDEGAVSLWKEADLWRVGIAQSDTRLGFLAYPGDEPWNCPSSWQMGCGSEQAPEPNLDLRRADVGTLAHAALSVDVLLRIASAHGPSFCSVLERLAPAVLYMLDLASPMCEGVLASLGRSLSAAPAGAAGDWPRRFAVQCCTALPAFPQTERLPQLAEIITTALRLENQTEESLEKLVRIIVDSGAGAAAECVLLAAVLRGARVEVPLRDPEKLLGRVLRSALSGEERALPALACIANHVGSDALEEKALAELLRPATKQTILPKMWLIKARIMRYSPSFDGLLKELAALLVSQDEHIAMQCAEGFKIIVADDPCIPELPFGRTKMFFRQRFFHHVLPQLLRSIPDIAQPPTAVLIAVATITGAVSANVVEPHLQTIFPLVLRSFLRNEPALRPSALAGLEQVIRQKPELLAPHVSAIYPILLRQSADQSSISLRLTALGVLQQLTTLPERHVLARHRKAVLRRLKNVFDDPRREVRAKAAECSEQWHLMDF